MEHLETVEVENTVRGAPFRMPVQWVNRPNQDFRGFAGRISSGHIAAGDRIRTCPRAKEAKVARIVTFDGDIPQATAGQSVTLTLDREIDVSRGDLLTRLRRLPASPTSSRQR
jgi:bifunctional enzyme CysN/CysC